MRNLICRVAGVAAVFLACTVARADSRAVWIDSDLSLGSPLREVDDGYALLLALHSPELTIVGVSATYGNAPLAGTTARLRKSLGAFGGNLSGSPGARSPADLGKPTAASDALAAALRRERLTYLALGPLTNLATFLRLHPAEAGRIPEVIMVVGKTPAATLGFGPEGRFRIHDANFSKDPVAVRAVLAARVPIVLAPIETSSRLQVDRGDLARLRASGPAGRYLASRSGAWLWFWKVFAHEKGGPLFDALAVIIAARPDLVTLEPRTIGGRKVLFCTAFAPETKRVLLDRLTARKAKSSTAPPGP